MPDDQQDTNFASDTHHQMADATRGVAARERPDNDPHDGVKAAIRMSPESEGDNQRKLALFDFDGTLTRQDSLKMIMAEMAGGKWRSYMWLALAFVTPFIESVATRDDYMDYKSAIKAHWMMHVLKGKTVDAVQDVARRLKDRIGWHEGVVADLKKLAEEGAEIVVATGALDTYIDVLLQGLPVNCVICTKAEVVDGKLTGALAGKKENANTVRHEKRVRVHAYIKANGPYGRVIGYGNMPDDGPMLSLCDDFNVI